MDDAEMRAAIGDALADVMARDGAMLTRWVVCAEIIDDGGDRALWMLTPTDQMAWDTLGMLRFADHQEAAGLVTGED